MSLATVNTILNTAPLILQGAARLIKLLRDQQSDDAENTDQPDSIEGLRDELNRVHQRLDSANQTTMQQIKLIEELAKQNESLASQLKMNITRLNRMTVIAVIGLLMAAISIGLQLI